MDDGVSLVRRLRTVSPAVVDSVLAAVLFAVAMVETITELDCHCVTRTDVTLTVGFLLAMTVPLVGRRRHPFVVLTVVGLAKVLYSDILDMQPDPVTAVFPVLLAVYSVAAYARRSLAVAGGILTLIALVVFNISELGSDSPTWPPSSRSWGARGSSATTPGTGGARPSCSASGRSGPNANGRSRHAWEPWRSGPASPARSTTS